MAKINWKAKAEMIVEQEEQELKIAQEREIAEAIPAMIKAVRELVKVSDLTAEELQSIVGLYPQWYKGTNYVENQLVRNEGILYRVIIGHPSQDHFRPEFTPTLYTPVTPPDTIAEWVQPTGSENAYNIGAQVEYIGFIWTSKIVGNTTEPNKDGGLHQWKLSSLSNLKSQQYPHGSLGIIFDLYIK